MGAKAMDFEMGSAGLKAGGAECEREGGVKRGIGEFGNLVTLGANQQTHVVRFVRVGAADEGVKAVNAVNKAMFEQEIETAVDGGRLDAVVFGGETVDEFVSLDRLVVRPNQFEHAPTQWRELGTERLATIFGLLKSVAEAACMVVTWVHVN